MTQSKTLIVGDIQGCFSGLMSLLAKAQFDERKDTLIAVGDLVARGEDSLATLKFLMSLGSRFRTVLGNHDLHLLAVSQGIKPAKKNDRLSNLLSDKHLPDCVDWLRQFPLALKVDTQTVVVHAGLYPQWSVSELLCYSEEVSHSLRGPNWRILLQQMYKNSPQIWSDKLQGISRLRFIINACTRMRFLKADAALEFATKHHPNDAPAGFQPWFRVNNDKLLPNEKIIFGHWAALDGETHSDRFIGLDTGYVWGNKMTALHLESNSVVQVSP
ncbi:symmetrical bis(5'-nucleosyl)-tetraphosphatase [Aestuariibacter sp. A3R04]|uniref:symmetrical bis(5'-nucleosyl)-tetraphosphatase n=1 Tax=Aestuariibacter sp. A3R04 TaxID=2841571 RepID=UPI001C091624|nr:symmetrical bis(5'-nucleosyl)-tetraphosphatase [Aestuariibacter sp. A3R04]MBU3020976.1 symmetrical bis(5'-nucleosyl)-tetraphosphatase [Aestuariibacter sp. A3R04]